MQAEPFILGGVEIPKGTKQQLEIELPKNENIHLVLVGEKMDGAETTSLIDKFKLKEVISLEYLI